MKTIRKTTSSASETEKFAAEIGNSLRGGELVVLRADVGGGKTTFTKGIVRGAGGDTAVTSPTFTIQQQYMTPRCDIYHYDLYRLHELGILEREIQEALMNPRVTVVAEWPDIASSIFDDSRAITIDILADPSDEQKREITMTFPEKYEYMRVEI